MSNGAWLFGVMNVQWGWEKEREMNPGPGRLQENSPRKLQVKTQIKFQMTPAKQPYSKMPNSPTLVFIPGAWHNPICYEKIIKALQGHHKLKCVSVTLPTTAGNPAATFKDDLDVARDAISNETSRNRDVVVLAHSYGGIVGNSAIKDFTKPRDSPPSPSTKRGRVIGLVLIASGFTFTGYAFMDPFLGHPPPSWRVNNDTGYAELVASPREFFYHDLPADEAEFWVSQLRPQSLKALFEGAEFTYAGWKEVPVWYIGTIEDHGLPVVVQRMQVGMARAMGVSVEHRELQTSHSPFLSQPEATTRIILEAVEAFTGGKEFDTSMMGGRGDLIALPKATLWQPFSWVRFGLPLVFGHVIGKGIRLFTWGRRLFWFY